MNCIEIPKINVPKIDTLVVAVNEIKVSAIVTQSIGVPVVSVPKINVCSFAANVAVVPKVNTPTVNAPTVIVPTVNTPTISVPPSDTLPVSTTEVVVTNFPEVQPVSIVAGSEIEVSNLPDVQPVSGEVTVSNLSELDEYNYIQSEEDATNKYYGFCSASGWQIKRKTLATGIWQIAHELFTETYATYELAWDSKENLEYDNF